MDEYLTNNVRGCELNLSGSRKGSVYIILKDKLFEYNTTESKRLVSNPTNQ
jgi:hypothetical protein